ncbi:hypothetical protein HELRODRAFT_152847, partial [Helobdella robusta]|uniref:SRCR domain-containing protein n=1 Tax=Helobdella robusta TaxID=6412 RepID=T1EKX6_HELRO
VSLKGGVGRGEGRVELKISNITGTICSDRWDDRDAKVICRMLGFNKAKAVRNARDRYGMGSGLIWASEVACRGDEHDVTECSSIFVGRHNCSHLQDAGVICS